MYTTPCPSCGDGAHAASCWRHTCWRTDCFKIGYATAEPTWSPTRWAPSGDGAADRQPVQARAGTDRRVGWPRRTCVRPPRSNRCAASTLSPAARRPGRVKIESLHEQRRRVIDDVRTPIPARGSPVLAAMRFWDMWVTYPHAQANRLTSSADFDEAVGGDAGLVDRHRDRRIVEAGAVVQGERLFLDRRLHGGAGRRGRRRFRGTAPPRRRTGRCCRRRAPCRRRDGTAPPERRRGAARRRRGTGSSGRMRRPWSRLECR